MIERRQFTQEQKDKMEKCFREFLSIVDDPDRPGLKETPHRVMKYWTELLEGQLYTNQEIADMYNKCFDLDEDTDEDDISLEYNNAIKRDLVVETGIKVFSHCFDKDTRILNPENNHKTISQFKVGDLVTTFNPETGALEDKKVVFVHKNKASDWQRLVIEGITTLATSDHPYFNQNFEQIRAKNLKVGDKVWVLGDESEMKLGIVEENLYEEYVDKDCYNLEIEDNHTYFANNTYVHNCEHHLALMYDMDITIAYIPKNKVIGLSKMGRIAEMCAKRLQLQEKLGSDINEVMRLVLGTEDVAVIITGKHGCMTARGIKSREASTVTSCLMGRFKTVPALREETLALMGRRS